MKQDPSAKELSNFIKKSPQKLKKENATGFNRFPEEFNAKKIIQANHTKTERNTNNVDTTGTIQQSQKRYSQNSYSATNSSNIYKSTKKLLTSWIASEFVNGTDLHQTSSPHLLKQSNIELQDNQIKITLDRQQKEEYLTIGDYIPSSVSRNILIVTRSRSGSSFLGDLLNRYPGTFYSYEPLHYCHKRGLETSESKIDLMKQLLQCKPPKEYVEHAKQWRPVLRWNVRLWKACESSTNNACYSPELFYSTCPIFPIRLIKTIRLPFNATEPLLLDPEIGNSLKVIYLFRDPRGIQQSLNSVCGTQGWNHINGIKSCKDLPARCENITIDVLDAMEMKKKNPDRVHLIRYEDLCMNTSEVVGNLLKFLNLSTHTLIDKYIKEHTETNKVGTTIYGTKRNSKDVAFEWRNKLSDKDITNVQEMCKEPMKKLGYIPLKNIPIDKLDPTYEIIQEAPKEILL